MELVSCASCQSPVDARACRCPHCDVQLKICGSNRSFAAALLALGLMACPTTSPQPDYGIPLTDDDGDGYFAEEDDCDDDDADVNPDAVEVPDNGMDDDCDGEIDESSI
jgi:hypothetical protein